MLCKPATPQLCARQRAPRYPRWRHEVPFDAQWASSMVDFIVIHEISDLTARARAANCDSALTPIEAYGEAVAVMYGLSRVGFPS